MGELTHADGGTVAVAGNARYISRPAIAERRLSLTTGGNVRYQLKTPYRDGTTHVIFEPLDFIARLAALVPKPRVNLTRTDDTTMILSTDSELFRFLKQMEPGADVDRPQAPGVARRQ